MSAERRQEGVSPELAEAIRARREAGVRPLLKSERELIDRFPTLASVQQLVLRRLVEASAPIEEDGGNEEQREAFSEAFQDACWVLACLEDEEKRRGR